MARGEFLDNVTRLVMIIFYFYFNYDQIWIIWWEKKVHGMAYRYTAVVFVFVNTNTAHVC